MGGCRLVVVVTRLHGNSGIEGIFSVNEGLINVM